MGGSERTPLSEPSASAGFRCTLTGCLQFFNLTAVSLLSVAVFFMFVQLQVITVRVAQTQHHIDQVLDKAANETQYQIEDLNVKVEEEHDLTILHIAGTFTLLTCLISMFHMTMHLRNFYEPFVQRKIVAILWMPPIYGITSFLGLLWPKAEGYLSIIKDFYEAYVIYQFLSFLIAVLGRGNREVVVQLLARHADHLDKPAKCLSPFYHPPPEEGPTAKANAVLMECQILAMQFVFCRPLTSIASFVCSTLMEADDSNNDEPKSSWSYFRSPLFYITLIQSVSVFFAFSGLLKFYHAVREDLLWCQPFPKFLAIKGVVFMTFWQGLVIAVIVNIHHGGRWSVTGDDSSEETPREVAMAIQNVLICLEMLFFSITHWCVFPVEEWEPGYRPRQYAKPGIGIKDFVSDMSLIVESSKASRRSRRANDKAINDLTLDEEEGEMPATDTALDDRESPLVASDDEMR